MKPSDKAGERIRQARLERGLTVRQLAVLSGVSASAIRRIENGTTKEFLYMTGFRIVNALGADIHVIAFGVPESELPDDISDL